MKLRASVVVGLLPVTSLLVACSDDLGSPSPISPPYQVIYSETREPCSDRNPLRNAYFGDLHVHTALSYDSYVHQVRAWPEDAYRFAKGEDVLLPPLDASGQGTFPYHIERPLDFAAVTDHSELLGEMDACLEPSSPVYSSSTCVALRSPDNYVSALVSFAGALADPTPTRFDWCGTDAQICLSRGATIWQRIQDAAEAAYDRTSACNFTSFVGYEYSSTPELSNVHRNIIFRNSTVPPAVISHFEEPKPAGLWAALEAQCTKAGTGCDVLAIPHNSNLSNGRMFRLEYPRRSTEQEQRDLASLRSRVEPLMEVFQHKGSSECMNGFVRGIAAPDEACDFEIVHQDPPEECGDQVGFGGMATLGCATGIDFLRGALAVGMQEGQRIGINPFKVGVIASTDTHNGIPGATEEQRWEGHVGADDGTPDVRLVPIATSSAGPRMNPGGLAGIWAQENSRDALFQAMKRRETWGTSGTRITVRMFGGWDFPTGVCADPKMVEKGYQNGVPMGSDLPPGAFANAPQFVVSALRDPGTATWPGTPLQRLQIVKGTVDATGTIHTTVYDIEVADHADWNVDANTCQTSGSGADTLCTRWIDPDFQRDQPAFYYARVLENPSCRWSTYECIRMAPADRPAACQDPTVPKLIRERAWTSPIWYAPRSGPLP